MLKNSFFERSSLLVAKDLIGKYLVRKVDDKIYRYRIVETESYEGFEDKASHSSRGLTLRNAPMFDTPGTLYVYFTYGMHYMLNIVCSKKGDPSAVLVRGVIDPDVRKILGPARVTKALHIDKSLNSKKLGRKSNPWIENGSFKFHTSHHKSPTSKKDDRLILMGGKKGAERLRDGKKEDTGDKIIATPRIGIDSAGDRWVKKKYRFIIKKYEYKKFK